jgi:hypothetical protein
MIKSFVEDGEGSKRIYDHFVQPRISQAGLSGNME